MPDQVAAFEKELKNGIDDAAMQRDQKTLDDLNRISGITAT